MDHVDAFWNDKTAGMTIPKLLPDRTLRIRAIGASPDEEGFGLWYEMDAVAEAAPAREAPREVWTAWTARNHWWLEGHDDRGTEYEAPSGAYGPTPEGPKTYGVLDIYPTPPADATWLDITLHGGGLPDDADHRQYTIRVELPLKTSALSESVEPMRE